VNQETPKKLGGFQIRSEAHGPHWIAWVVGAGQEKPLNAVVLVGQTREEAETRARRWAEQMVVQSATA
jgi:hypothetical protein